MSARCDLSDLPVDQCGCRIHAPEEKPDRGAEFEARYAGTCAECDGGFGDGEWIVRHPLGGYVHSTCA